LYLVYILAIRSRPDRGIFASALPAGISIIIMAKTI